MADTRLSTVSDRAFPVAAPSSWNGLSQYVTSAPSASLQSAPETYLFTLSFL